MSKKITGYPSIDKPQNKGYSILKQNPLIPNISIYNGIRMLNAFYSENQAIDCMDLTVNYSELFDDAITISKAFKELGVKKGEIISVHMPNYYQAVAVFLASNRIGAVTTFLNANAKENEICEYLNLFESPILINYDKTREENTNIKSKSKVRYIITLQKSKINARSLNEDYTITGNTSSIDFNSLGSISRFQKCGLSSNSGKDNSLILYTSGTTGKPKSVVLTNENVLAAATYLKNSSNVKSLNGNRTLVCVPFSYPYGFVTSTLMTLLSSKTAVLAPNISKETIRYYISKRTNIIFGSPALLELFMKNTNNTDDLSSITTFISGGDFLTPNQRKMGQEFFKNHGALDVEIGNGSGNAETVSCGTNPTGVEPRPETVGKILVGTTAIVVDPDTMEEKKYNEVGLLCVSGKHVFKEYYNNDELTSEVKFERKGKVYFKTGTLGSIDEDGYFTLTGRESRFYINSSLNKIYCDRVQTIISNIEGISECAVVKVPDEEFLYVNKAYIVLDKNIELFDESKIKELLSSPIQTLNGLAQLKDYEVPQYIEFVSELPKKAGTDKINYSLLEDDAFSKLNHEKVKNKSK